MSSLRKRFEDGAHVPTSLVLHLTDSEFFDIANNVFDFDEARVMTNTLSLLEGRAEFSLNYLAHVGPSAWRKLRLAFEGIESIDFSYLDENLGSPRRFTRHLDLDRDARGDRLLLQKAEAQLSQDLADAELSAIWFEDVRPRRGFLGRKEKPPMCSASIDWLDAFQGEPGYLRSRIVAIVCHTIEIQFLSPPAEAPWPK